MTTTKKEKQYIKKNQQLPREFGEIFESFSDNLERDQLIKKLVEASWTYEAISSSSGLTRERIRQIANATELLALEFDFDIPKPPFKAERKKREYVEPTPGTLARLLELQPYAQQVRANGSKYRKEAEEYTKLLDHAHRVEGVTIYRLAKRLGITHGAVRFRLVRYGYLQPKTGKSKVYTPIIRENRLTEES